MSSPRLSSESTSTIGSLPSSKGDTTARRRLREFYRLQAAGAASTPPPPEISVTKVDENKDEDEEEYADGENSILDNEDTNIENWVKDMVKQNDLKSLLKSENRLVRQLGELESSQKALVYNNYNKLISASSTLEAMRESRREKAVDFEGLKKSLQTISQTSSVTRFPQRKAQDKQLRESLHEKQAARWVLGVERSMTHLKQTGKRNEAIAMGQKAVRLIGQWLDNLPDGDHEIKELALIRERCQGMLSVL